MLDKVTELKTNMRNLVKTTFEAGWYRRPSPLDDPNYLTAEEFLMRDVDDVVYQAQLEGLKRHTWQKDGVTYVGNGTYTLAEAEAMLKRDLGYNSVS